LAALGLGSLTRTHAPLVLVFSSGLVVAFNPFSSEHALRLTLTLMPECEEELKSEPEP
jgi:hypothetical protein